MAVTTMPPSVDVSPELLEAIESFPAVRSVAHCGSTFRVPALDIYAPCPTCGTRIKVRSFGGGPELEDVFDAVARWLTRPGAEDTLRRRRQQLADDPD
jgi:hypothetical protein